MAAKNNNHEFKHTYRPFVKEIERNPNSDGDSITELYESDIMDSFYYGVTKSEYNKKSIVPSARISRKDRSGRVGGGGDRAVVEMGGKSASLPVSIPHWSRRNNSDEDDDEEDEDEMVPPHEYLARQFALNGIVSLSVHEGIGRTLKGRDLRRVRNAIWQKTGFQD
ncbi:hypothetical protein QJS04_geneDACA015345 [Acorus gramineus]|uniref:Senescence regulator n=1 Tax=Acorus gramineus TaxID=55184 RepID=A0AAV9AP13_ACOGR|nr:hypothetical protein QJS04_geneDACA015345 [Acorus gramineus]